MNKYKKKIKGVEIDVYDILHGFEVKSHAIGHAIKKLLMPGQRGSKGYEQDLKEAIQSIQRAIDDVQESVRLEQLPDDGWIDHNGTQHRPVHRNEQVETISPDGARNDGIAGNMEWLNIAKYRLINKESK